MILILLGLVWIGKYSSFGEWFQMDNIVALILSYGLWGYVVFIVLMVTGSFIHIPVFLLVLAAVLTYGQLEGTILGFIGVVMACIVNFLFSRFFGGKAKGEVSNPFLYKQLQKLRERPIYTMIVIRFFMWGSPLVNFTLGLTHLKTVHYIVGTALGLVIPFMIFSAAVLFFREAVFSFVGG
ncbi:MAG: hypothetical protein HKN92_09450 [Chitinophagales bacterium]|nr:hypothetical protein [Chitinophagales bacterium]